MLDLSTEKSFEERFSIIRTLSPKKLVSKSEVASLTFMDAGLNSFFTYLGSTYYVKEKTRYEETSEDFKTRQGYFVTELSCLCIETGLTFNFEWEFDDELEVSLTLWRTSFTHLFDEEGQSIDGDDLDQIAQDKDVIVHKGERFQYEDDWSALYLRNGKEEKVYMYEFANQAGNVFLTIEEWTGNGREEYQIYVSKPIDAGQIEILSRGE